MNLPNKITMGRIILAVIILIMLVFPFYQINLEFPTWLLFNRISVNSKYILVGILFIIASVTDFIDGKIARSRNMVTDFGKVMDAIADKILVNGVLIMLAYDGFISVIIPIVIITRDTFVDSIKMVAGNKGKAVGASFLGKAKTMCMMIGIVLMLFYNLPFEIFNIRLADVLLLVATILSVISACQYFYVNKKFILEDK